MSSLTHHQSFPRQSWLAKETGWRFLTVSPGFLYHKGYNELRNKSDGVSEQKEYNRYEKYA